MTDLSNDSAAPIYWIAHEAGQVKHGTLDPGGRVSTGLAHVERHTSPREWKRRRVFLAADYDAALREWLAVERLADPIEYLSDLRWRRETGGLTLPDGRTIRTTRESQSQIVGAVTSLSMGLMAEPIEWKLESGWVHLSAAQITGIAALVSRHVAACFGAERAVAEQLDADAATEIEAAFDAAYASIMAGG
jgi:hypothetical protein